MLTRNQIRQLLEDFATNHKQIKSFGYGEEFEQQGLQDCRYPLMWVVPIQSNISNVDYSRNYQIGIFDRVRKDESNEMEVESDTELICLDALAHLSFISKKNENTLRFNRDSISITPVYAKWADEVTGNEITISLVDKFAYDKCAIPMDDVTPIQPTPCADATITINGFSFGNAPSGQIFPIIVENDLGAQVGEKIGSKWIVPIGGDCENATYDVVDTDGNILYTGSIVSGGSAEIEIGNSSLNVNKSDGNLISSRSILAEGTDSYNVADSVAVIKDSANNTLKTENIKATESENISISDSVAVIKNSLGTTLKTENILAEATENITINNSTLNVRKSDGSLISARTILAEATDSYNVSDSNVRNSDTTYSQNVKATENLVLLDSQINVNGSDEGDVVSVKTINVNIDDGTNPVTPTNIVLVGNDLTISVQAGASPSGVEFKFPIYWQRNSYRTGDVGWRMQDGWMDDLVNPSNPKAVADLDYSDANWWQTLLNPLIVNGVSNTLRFTDVDGGQAWSATGNKNLVTIDKLTSLMYYNRNINNGADWNGAIDNALALSIVVDGVTYDDWFLASQEEYLSIFGAQRTASGGLNTSGGTLIIGAGTASQWTANTIEGFSTFAYQFTTGNPTFTSNTLKTTAAQRSIYVRKAKNLITAP